MNSETLPPNVEILICILFPPASRYLALMQVAVHDGLDRRKFGPCFAAQTGSGLQVKPPSPRCAWSEPIQRAVNAAAAERIARQLRQREEAQ